MQAVTGFGFALVVVPPSIVLVDRLTVVTALIVMSPSLNALLVGRIKAEVDRRLIVTVLVAALAGMPLGLLVLRELPNAPFQVLAGTLSIAFAALLQTGRFRLPQRQGAYAATGFLSGAIQMATTMSGPPIVIMLLSGDRTTGVVRRTLAVLFIGMAIPTLAILALTHSTTREGVLFGVAAIPVVLLSGYAGDQVARRLPLHLFRVLSLGAIYAAGAFGVVSGLQAF